MPAGIAEMLKAEPQARRRDAFFAATCRKEAVFDGEAKFDRQASSRLRTAKPGRFRTCV
jgi:hypothetical protein